ncbi:adhesion protein FadA [Fusobacterium varium]|uniref:adhesion protein FadA n=1 Tax=Fusobacterium TaxID=848 RepID=UPI0030CE0F1A
MKKLLVLGTIVLSASMMGAEVDNLEARFKGLEQEYNLLIQKEQEKFNTEKKIAEVAQSTLAKQREIYNQLSEKVAKLNQMKDVKFYKEQYGELVSKYQAALKDLEAQMKEQENIINRFRQLEALKTNKSK